MRSHAVELVVGARLLIFHLDLVAAAQVDAAVAEIGAVVFDVQFEIFELARGPDVRAGSLVDKFTVDRLVVVDLRVVGVPIPSDPCR